LSPTRTGRARAQACSRLLAPALLVAATFTGCDARPAVTAPPAVPESMRECAQCHARVVASYLGHGMANSLGPLTDPPTGALDNPATGNNYRFDTTDGVTTLTLTTRSGGQRRQQLVGRIGAGVLDMSFVGAEIDAVGVTGQRLYFAPVERITGHGLALAPFELGDHPAGLDQPVTAQCLSCHTTDVLAQLPAAAAGSAGPGPSAGRHIYPGNLLGADALHRLSPLGCSACHGDTARHADIMLERVSADGNDIGLAQLGSLPAAVQRDVCALCHLEGDARLELVAQVGYGPHDDVLHGLRPVLVPAMPDDDFRLVGQLERLALSACFRNSPDMTCTSCHAPHASVAAQGPAAFDQACIRCHAGGRQDCARGEALSVEDVTGQSARTPDGCIDCHVRRSQPFDLPLLRTADHHVRRRIPLPAEVPMRHYAKPTGALQPFDDGRLAATLATDAGRAWSAGLIAAGLFRIGRHAEAAANLDAWSAGQASHGAPAGLPSLESSASFAHLRGLILEAVGRPAEAQAAYDRALAIDGNLPESRVNRAALLLAAGRTPEALADAALLATLHPQSELPWNLRARAAALTGNVPATVAALSASTQRWGSDPATWHELGRLLLRLDRRDLAAAALAVAGRLDPSRPGLAEDVATASGR